MWIFKGSNGVRAGWRFLLFVAVWFVLGTYVFGYIASKLPDSLFAGGLTPQGLLIGEIFDLLTVLGATALMAWLEHRSILAYGFTPSPRAFPQAAEGVLLGVASTLAVALLMIAFGGMHVQGFALHGSGWAYYPLAWLVVMIGVGFTEEATFRGYPLFALSRGIGFWPAALAITALFGAAHVGKTGENAVDIASVIFLGLFLCFALWKTGTLWLAVGFHAAFDFMQFFVIGTRNGSQLPVGTLFNSTFPGPEWVNGGPLGTEASYFMFPVTIVLFAYVAWRYRGKTGTFAA